MARHARRVLGSSLAAFLLGCGPSAGFEALADGDGGGGGLAVWEPPTDAQEEPGPAVLAMATRGDLQQLVAIGERGQVTPFGEPLPASAHGAALHQLNYHAHLGRGALVRRSEEGSEVFAFDGETIREVGVGLPPVQWISLSREGWLVVLHHEDRSTSVVSHEDEVLLELAPHEDPDRNNFLGFGDGDGWVMWYREVDPNETFSAREYWVHEFATGETRRLATIPFGTARWFTFGTSMLLQLVGEEEDTMWMDLAGNPIDVPGMPTTRIGPQRHFFVDGRAYALRDREVVELGPQALVPGFVHAYVPGRYTVVDTDEGSLHVLPPDGGGDVALEAGSHWTYSPWSIDATPDRLQVVVSRQYDDQAADEQAFSLWRPWTGESIHLGNDYASTIRAFTEDGTLIRVQDDGVVTAVMPDADELVELDTSPWQLEGFSWAHLIDRQPPQRGDD